MDEYLIEMSRQGDVLSMFLITILLVLSYQYVVDEAEAAATADPTHTGKALLATLMPFLWIIFIICGLCGALLLVFGELS